MALDPSAHALGEVLQQGGDAGGKLENGLDAQRMWRNFSAMLSGSGVHKFLRGSLIPGLALGAVEGAGKSINQTHDGRREQWEQDMGWSPQTPLQSLGADTVRTLGNVGDAILMDQTGNILDVGRRLMEPNQALLNHLSQVWQAGNKP